MLQQQLIVRERKSDVNWAATGCSFDSSAARSKARIVERSTRDRAGRRTMSIDTALPGCSEHHAFVSSGHAVEIYRKNKHKSSPSALTLEHQIGHAGVAEQEQRQ